MSRFKHEEIKEQYNEYEKKGIIAKFHSQKAREAVFSNRKKLGSQQFKDGKGRSKYFINESLSKLTKICLKLALNL